MKRLTNRKWYVIKQKNSYNTMPFMDRANTGVTPCSDLPPRMFSSRRAAQCALTWWLKGNVTVTKTRHETGIFGAEYDETWQIDKVPGRRAEDFEIVPAIIKIGAPV